ncbi:hypothetical protein HMPREF1155_1499 [Slackia sp. CM382]|nr:hypothetical protein HMPREF1155_1499 [Slackia sp. CM382]
MTAERPACFGMRGRAYGAAMDESHPGEHGVPQGIRALGAVRIIAAFSRAARIRGAPW